MILLECRMEQLRSQLEVARAEADHARVKLAEASAREAKHARRQAALQEELAEARQEIVTIHERLDRSEALRAELEGHLFESGAQGETAELIRLRRDLAAERHRAGVNERQVARLRDRVDELLASRETLLTRVAAWQKLVNDEGPEAVDLSGYLSELLREIVSLERRSEELEGREARLRDGGARIERDRRDESDMQDKSRPESRTAVRDSEPGARAAEAPEAPRPTDALVSAIARADLPLLREELRAIGEGAQDDGLAEAVRPLARSSEAAVRAAAYEALGRLMERDPVALASVVREGLTDENPRVRRRVVLAAATARGLELRSLLAPLQEDPDPQVRRVVREALRQGASAAGAPRARIREAPSLTTPETVP